MAESKFTPGKSGNPKGRPKNKTAPLILRKAIVEAMPEIIQGLIDAAKLGDVGAATVLLNRCVPALKPEALAVCLPVKETLTDLCNEIVKSIVTGKIPPDVGSQLISALAGEAKNIEVDDL